MIIFLDRFQVSHRNSHNKKHNSADKEDPKHIEPIAIIS